MNKTYHRHDGVVSGYRRAFRKGRAKTAVRVTTTPAARVSGPVWFYLRPMCAVLGTGVGLGLSCLDCLGEGRHNFRALWCFLKNMLTHLPGLPTLGGRTSYKILLKNPLWDILLSLTKMTIKHRLRICEKVE